MHGYYDTTRRPCNHKTKNKIEKEKPQSCSWPPLQRRISIKLFQTNFTTRTRVKYESSTFLSVQNRINWRSVCRMFDSIAMILLRLRWSGSQSDRNRTNRINRSITVYETDLRRPRLWIVYSCLRHVYYDG